ncbi:hypothetical protein JY651_25715 [Pyxidicoccus parkwayensis]|uniref:Tetratricopeptide repeat protein n=1 Tax=Pyxidicoccus parkwayensis TaxID=2813578 RepID=A0ABX7NME8_9BACT|nr:hypothetical protein [Pyxidicoccus parkwaysis]QSQ18760.1 hypothetical protein JY651_25715 [Pyxidicoccus parkwaysis]
MLEPLRDFVKSHSAAVRVLVPFVLLTASDAGTQSTWAAQYLADRCQFGLALEQHDKASSDVRDSPEGILFRARLLVQLERGAEAARTLDRLPPPKDSTEEAQRLLLRGLALSSTPDMKGAQAALRRARKLGADAALIDQALAVLWLEHGELERAEKLLLDVLRREPLMSGALFNLASLRARQGRLAEAAALIRQSWHAGLRDAGAIQRDPALAPLLKTPMLLTSLNPPDSDNLPQCHTY